MPGFLMIITKLKMKILNKLIAVYFLLTLHVAYAQKNDLKVQPFLPEIFSRFPGVRDIAISPGENEIYFTVQSYLGELSSIVTTTFKNGNWSAPEIANFSGKYQDLEPFLSTDGLRLFFVSNRPKDAVTSEAGDYDIWFVERTHTNSTWSSPKNIGAPVNTKENEFYPSVSKFNTLCFTRDGVGSKGKDDIFLSKWENGKYTAPFSMSDSINTTGYEFNAFLAPDESFLVYTCYNRMEGNGSGDLYISYKKTNEEWADAKNLEEINSPQMDYCPFINSAGILYFTSKRSTVKSRQGKSYDMRELLGEMNKYENGQSHIYKVNINPLLQHDYK